MKFTYKICKRCNKVIALENDLCSSCQQKEAFWNLVSDILQGKEYGIQKQK